MYDNRPFGDQTIVSLAWWIVDPSYSRQAAKIIWTSFGHNIILLYIYIGRSYEDAYVNCLLFLGTKFNNNTWTHALGTWYIIYSCMHVHSNVMLSTYMSHVILPATCILLHVDALGLLNAIRTKTMSQTSLPVSIINGTCLLPNLCSLAYIWRTCTNRMWQPQLLNNIQLIDL